MPIAIRCSSCQAAFRVRDEYAGKRGKCPKCGAIFLAAAQVSPAEAPPASPPHEPELPDPAPRIRASEAQPKSPAARSAPAPVRPARRLSAAGASTGNAWPDFDPPEPTSQAISAADDRLARVAARGRKKPRPKWVWLATAGVLLAGVIALFGYQMWSGGAQQTAQRRLDPEARRIAQGNAPRTAGFVPKPAEKLDLKKPGPGASTEDIIAYVEHGIVKIDVYDEYNNRHGLGSGFVIDDSGLIATTYHVIDDAVKAEVQFNDGIRYGVEGYVALRPESDLAVLKLNGTPPNMRALALHPEGQPRTAAQVYSIGHPLGYEFQVTNGIVSRVLKTSQLPAEAQSFLRSSLSDKIDNLWVSHTAQISPGNSGGPLLNSQGEVIGVNSWVNQQINLGYAVHVGALHEMLQQKFPQPHPLKEHRRPPPNLADVGTQWGIEVTPDRLKAIAAEMAARKYACGNPQDYARLQELALALTYVLHLRAEPEATADKLKEVLPELLGEADAIVAALRGVAWETGLVKSTNAQAEGMLSQRLKGAFLFGRVERVLEGQEGARRGALIQLLESDQMIFVPLSSTLKNFQPTVGANFLVVGISFGAALPYGDNPLEPKTAPIVLCELLVELPGLSAAPTPAEPKVPKPSE